MASQPNGSSDKPKTNTQSPAYRPKGSTTPGALTYALLRLLDLPLQYKLLTTWGPSLISTLHGTPLTPSPSLLSPTAPNTIPGLSPYYTLIFGLATASALKHTWWSFSILNYVFRLPLMTGIAGYNTGLNIVNGVLSLWAVSSNNPFRAALTSGSWSELFDIRNSSVPIGVALFAVGMGVEIAAEVQRKAFKARPENKDRPFAGGLFGVVRNVNYTGYLLWRVGYAICCAGLPWAAVILVQQGGDFAFRAVPEMDSYCEQRYGEQWDEVRKKVPYRLIPYIY
ncbi:hypothetical protein MBLNU457_3519t1 [Dothideomycetes sp. NU457]